MENILLFLLALLSVCSGVGFLAVLSRLQELEAKIAPKAKKPLTPRAAIVDAEYRAQP